MFKTVARIEGMACSMCEAHIADTIRKTFPDAKKVTASRKKCEATFLTENAPEESILKQAIDATGYTFVSAVSEPYVKKGLFS